MGSTEAGNKEREEKSNKRAIDKNKSTIKAAAKGAATGAAIGVGSAALQKVGQKLQDRKIKKLEGKGKSLSYKQKDKLVKLQSKKAKRKKVTVGTALKRGAAGAAVGGAAGALNRASKF